METMEAAGGFIFGILVVSGIPVVMLFLLGYWLRGYRTSRASRPAAGLRSLGGVPSGDACLEGHRASKPHCWECKNCPAVQRLSCPAYQRSYLPCWLAVQLAYGELKPACRSCELYDLRQAA